jgi:hypothetical protein
MAEAAGRAGELRAGANQGTARGGEDARRCAEPEPGVAGTWEQPERSRRRGPAEDGGRDYRENKAE